MVEQPLVIVGAGAELEQCSAAWKSAQPDRTIESLEVESLDHFNRILDDLDRYPAHQWCAFAAMSGSGLNMARLKLMADIRMKGYRLDSFVSPSACVPTDLKRPENCFISAGAVVEDSVKIRHNLYLGPRAIVSFGAQVGHSVWIGAGVLIGRKASIGDNCLVGNGAVVADDVKIGKLCELNIAQEYRTSIESKTFFSPMFKGPVRIYGTGKSADR